METTGYVDDIFIRHLLYGRTVRSPIARGCLLSIECPKLPNFYTLITAADIPVKNELEGSTLPILAHDKLSYIGEPVALLIGPDMAKLDEYHKQCKVITENETPVFSPKTASDGIVIAERNINIGNTEEVFRKAKTIVESNYTTGIQEHWYAEPTGAVVNFKNEKPVNKPDNVFIVYTATQWPHHVKQSVARMLKIDPDLVQVEPAALGMHMDGKLMFPSLIACHAALGALVTKKPVKLVLTKEEDFRFSPKRNSSEISIKSALDKSGKILGAEIDVNVNLGAYGLNTAEILDQTCLGSLSLWPLDNLKLTGRAMSSNIPPQGPFSGFGLAMGFFAAEQHASYIADTCRQNPAEWRKENYLKDQNLPLGLAIRENPPVEQLLDNAASISDYYRKWASYELIRQSRQENTSIDENFRGIGISVGYQGSGLLYPYYEKDNFGIEITLEKDGSLEIKTNIVSSDDGFPDIWTDIATKILGLYPENVKVITNADILNTGPSIASRNITAMTRLVENSCIDLRKQHFRDPLPITVKRNLRPHKNLQWEERFPPLGHKNLNALGFTHPGWIAVVVEVEIDQVDYFPHIRGIWVTADGGKILNEEKAHRNLKLGVMQALGWSYLEQLSYTNGAITHNQFESYNIPQPSDFPPITIEFIRNESGDPKGIGDLPLNSVPAAFLQAASQAMDHHFCSIPLTTADLWNAVNSKKYEDDPE